MKECVKIKRLLSRYLDKETGSVDTALIEAHLDSCSLCKQELSGFARVKGIILERQRKALPQDFLVCRLRGKIVSERLASGEGFSWLEAMGNLSRRLMPVPVSAIALLIALLILTSGQQVSSYSLEERILEKTSVTTETALGLILGAYN